MVEKQNTNLVTHFVGFVLEHEHLSTKNPIQ